MQSLLLLLWECVVFFCVLEAVDLCLIVVVLEEKTKEKSVCRRAFDGNNCKNSPTPEEKCKYNRVKFHKFPTLKQTKDTKSRNFGVEKQMNPVCRQVDEVIRKYGIDSFDEPKRSFAILLAALLANFREESNKNQRALYKELEKRFDSLDAKLHVLCELAAQEQGFRYEARVRNYEEDREDFDLDAEKSGVSRIYRLVDESEDVRQGFMPLE